MPAPPSMPIEVLRYAAFTTSPSGGNPAGLVLDATAVSETEMLDLARAVGYSETAFLVARPGVAAQFDVRYFSPRAEVPFCGHATIAAAVALAERGVSGELLFHTSAGPVPVRTRFDAEGAVAATLTSVAPRLREARPELLELALHSLGWSAADLDPTLPARLAYAGAWHLILGAGTRGRLAALEYDFERLREVMAEADLTTVDLLWRERPERFHARNPFPVGGVYEDPATGAAAAALGGYLRSLGLVAPPAIVTVLQGEDMGRPSVLEVAIPSGEGGIEVSGGAVAIP